MFSIANLLLIFLCRSVSDDFKLESIEPLFPSTLRSSFNVATEDLIRKDDKKLRVGDILLFIGELEVTIDDNDKAILRKVMSEKFKVSYLISFFFKSAYRYAFVSGV